jgi:Insertion element 4 transposase N-terminal
MADAVLEEARARERWVRLLPSRTGVYFVLALCLFPQDGCLAVWGRLTAALDGLGLTVPSAKALRCLRRRVGAAPLRLLFGALAGPLGQPRNPGRHVRRVPDGVLRRLPVGQGP